MTGNSGDTRNMSKAIDNWESVTPFMKFDSPDDFYFLQILQRRKENPDMKSNSRVVKNYYIRSMEYLAERYEEIKGLCEHYQARAGLRLNRRSHKAVMHRMMVNLANSLAEEDYQHGHKLWDKSCGQRAASYPKIWVLDIDDRMPFSDFVLNVVALVNSSHGPEGKNALAAIASRTGTHLLTQGFDARELRATYPEITIHKDNPTNLYIPGGANE